jgi:probable selenium-dependent hydroxylase accessory protein YqeC
LGLKSRELVALVGGGGKTGALGLLAREMAAAGGRVMVTTTTAMFRHELAAVGELVIEADDTRLTAQLRTVLAGGQIAAVAHSLRGQQKVAGLLPTTVDRLWAEGEMDSVIVEADGSRGRSLKAFAPHEPQVPARTTVIVQLAGLDVVGAPLTAQRVHRADELAAALRMPLGTILTPRDIADCLRRQLRRLRGAWACARLVTLLTKADRPSDLVAGEEVAHRLLEGGASSPAPADAWGDVRPDRVVLASLQDGRFARIAPAGA